MFFFYFKHKGMRLVSNHKHVKPHDLMCICPKSGAIKKTFAIFTEFPLDFSINIRTFGMSVNETTVRPSQNL